MTQNYRPFLIIFDEIHFLVLLLDRFLTSV